MLNRIVTRDVAHSSSYQETDKATIDVEAQDDGILGKILVRVPMMHVGQNLV